jgi:uroporphyrinogen decarboxylase
MDLSRAIFKLNFPRLHKPDFERFRRAILTREVGPVPFGELFADVETVGAVLNERVIDYNALAMRPDPKLVLRDYRDGYRFIRQTIQFCLNAGWDYAFSFSMIPFPNKPTKVSDNTAELAKDRKRLWVDYGGGAIRTWQDFEQYPWPTDFHGINMISRVMALRVPDGMKVMVIPGGVFEWVSQLMGMVNFCYALQDQLDLVDALIEKVTTTIFGVSEDILQEPNVGGLFMGDDLGYFSGTIISPKVLRERFIPKTKKIIDLTHQANKLFLFHTCGNMYSVMDDLIDAGIDGKHSFEDKILPVEKVYEKWGDKIALVGGVDIDLLVTGTEKQVRKRTREILDACACYGHYVLGTGNSVTNYIPVANYLAMLAEGQKWNNEHFKD